MKLHENEEEFLTAIAATAEALSIRDSFIEKDYWVTFALKKLALSKFKSEVVFKGGTSLSKAYKIIERFSEDIDLAFLRNDSMSGNQIKAKLKEIEETIIAKPFIGDESFIGTKGSKIRKTAYHYPKKLNAYNFGMATDKMILELNAFTHPLPNHFMKIQSYIGEHLTRVVPI